MTFLKNLLSRSFNSKTPKTLQNNPLTHNFNFHLKPFSSSPQPQLPNLQTKKPLSTFFLEVMSGKSTTIDQEEENSEFDIELKNKLKQLTEQVRTFNEKKPKKVSILTKGVSIQPKGLSILKKNERKSLYSAFTNLPVPESVMKAENVEEQKVDEKKEKKEKEEKKEIKKREPFVVKEFSIDMLMFLQYLYENGYFKDAKFANVGERFDIGWFENQYAMGYIKFAAVKFACDNREIAKWLSGSALKQVAAFGCPSTPKSIVFPAKRLRKFFEIPENTVCSKCKLRESCEYVNQTVWKCDAKKLDSEIVMKVIISYASQLVHSDLVVSDEVNKSVNHLLNEFVKLSKVT